MTAAPQPKFRKDYTPTPYLVDTVSLDFNLNEDSTKVVAKSAIKPNHAGTLPPFVPCGCQQITQCAGQGCTHTTCTCRRQPSNGAQRPRGYGAGLCLH